MSWYIEEQERIYLDFNATTPLNEDVKKAICEGLTLWGNPSSSNEFGKQAKAAVEAARGEVAQLFHVSPKEVFFTSGGTETNTWVIHNAIEHYKALHGRDEKPHIVSSAIEHPSILQPLRELKNAGEIDHTEIGVDATTGYVSLEQMERSLCDRTCLVTVMLANNETGVIQPLADVSSLARKAEDRFESRIFVHSDAAQAVGKIDVNLSELKVDFVTVVGHKFYGPRIGALVIRSQMAVPLRALFLGGGQECGKRSGTENTPMIMGLGAAARVASERLSEFSSHLRSVRDFFEEGIKSSLGDAAVIHFAKSTRLPNTSSVAFVKYSGTAAEMLSKCKSFVASTGAACHAASVSVSAVLSSCGIRDEVAMRTVRFSFGRETTREDVQRVLNELKSIAFFSTLGSSLLKAINKGPVPGF